MDARDYFGRTPMMDASCSGNVDIMRAIINYVEDAGIRLRRNSLNCLRLTETSIPGGAAKASR